MSSLAELFPDGDYRFQLTLRRGEPREFFAAEDVSGGILAQRRRWIAESPRRYAALENEGERAFAEFAGWCRGWGVTGTESPESLGGALEPDFLLLTSGDDGQFRLRGGALCFPTGWALEDKIGQPLEAIHGVVPGLNQDLGRAIQQFLGKLKAGPGYLRDNWGIAATDELNLHPVRGLPPPRRPVALDRLWLRVEHQILAALPESGAVLFGIRIRLHRLDDVARNASAATGLARALRTMPGELVAYKRLEEVRDELISRFA